MLTALDYFRDWELKDEQDVTAPPGSRLELFKTKQTKEMAAISEDFGVEGGGMGCEERVCHRLPSGLKPTPLAAPLPLLAPQMAGDQQVF